MFGHILVLIVWLPLAVFSSVVESLFSREELNDMGIRLEYPYATES